MESNFSHEGFEVMMNSSAIPTMEKLPPSLVWPPSSLTFTSMAITTTLILLVTYIKTWLAFTKGMKTGERGVPNVFPHFAPWVGSAVSFGFNPAGCIGSIARAVGPNGVFGIRLIGLNLYVLTGRQNVAQIRKYKGNITDPGVHELCLTRVFGVARKAVKVYSNDDSGIQTRPVPSSTVEPHNRVDHLTHATFLKVFSGEGLNTLFRRWYASFSRRLIDLNIGDEWIQGPDLEAFWMLPLVASLNEAMAGPILEASNPNFTQNFIDFYPYTHPLLKGLPRWLMPRAVQLRESIKRDFKNWHAIARALFRDSDIEEDDTDRWWGLSAIRERQRVFTKVDNWDHSTLASLDFGLLWGANLNSHTSAIWMIIEVCKDPDLLRRVRAELSTLTTSPTDGVRWIEELNALPLLQSVYAEVLRLRTGVQTVFRDNRQDIHINGWRFPKKSLLIVPTQEAHTDETFWNTRNGQYPVTRFWADRFLAYPDDPESGPSREIDPTKTYNMSKQSGPKFVNVGSTDAWIPYGIGERACPGRFFARRQMLAFCAIIVDNFDVELSSLGKSDHVPSGGTFYGLGVLRPKNRLPFRLRRRVR